MAVDLIGGAASALQSVNLQSQSLSQQEFLNILLTQLQFQDPMKPFDNQEFLAQMAQFSSLAQTSQMNERIDTLLSLQAATQSIGLLGKAVQVDAPSGAFVGTVASLNFANGAPTLTVAGSDGALVTGVSVSQISVVR